MNRAGEDGNDFVEDFLPFFDCFALKPVLHPAVTASGFLSRASGDYKKLNILFFASAPKAFLDISSNRIGGGDLLFCEPSAGKCFFERLFERLYVLGDMIEQLP